MQTTLFPSLNQPKRVPQLPLESHPLMLSVSFDHPPFCFVKNGVEVTTDNPSFLNRASHPSKHIPITFSLVRVNVPLEASKTNGILVFHVDQRVNMIARIVLDLNIGTLPPHHS
ncbi:hypothetical protein V6Z12_D08G125100 [Gossypium hirsutum]